MPEAAGPPGRPRVTLGLVTLVGIVVGLAAATLALGSVAIPLPDVVAILGGADLGSATTIVEQVRGPRLLTALLAGAALGVGGLIMQTLFRNPLADPFILGISAGASLGVALVVLLVGTSGTALVAGLSVSANLGVVGAAAVGAAAVTLLVLAASRRVASPATVLIIGLMVGYATTAIVSVLVHGGFGRFERVQAYIAWGFGSFAGTTWSELAVLAPAVVVGLGLAAFAVKPLNALLLGDAYAATMGVRVVRARRQLVIAASVLAGAVTAYCGPIAFIGIAAPHLARGLLRTSDHRVLAPATVLVGAAIALAAGLVAQLPGREATLPLNAVTSLVGAPVVVAVLLRLRRSSRAVAA
ncbi:iron ABC transporter permease [Egibacter rhizosphaerae]|uniref:Iron ABC transporter permease n=1 Tax=Egibacter rhizosphaerae TaxID=1670831 RepID=A0A411YLQ1_9ACTN|nr:iron ABC transporter permease [Egibacter rhizosphaerae]